MMLSARTAFAPVFAPIAVIFAVLFGASTSTTTAQSATGDIQGTIVDTSGAVLPGVTVTITNRATRIAREMVTDAAGFFAVPDLPVGPYEVQASHQGFATRRQPDLLLHVGQAITLRLELGVAQAAETITVAGPTPMIETTRSQVTTVMTSAELEHLPLRDRNALTLALTTPGVTSTSFNRIVWDGHERSHRLVAPHWISQEAAHSIEVSTNSYTAEYGRASGGIINGVTKSGSNDLRGSVLGLRGESATQFSGAAGGPLARDRHFAYGIYDDIRYPAYDQHLFLAKTDHRLADGHRVFLRYNVEGSQVGSESANSIDGSTRAFGASATSTIGSTLFNEARFFVGRDRYTAPIVLGATVTGVQFADTLTWLRGEHTLKSGVDVQLDRPYVSDSSVFVQDEWRPGQELTINFGVRYDAQRFSQSDYNNFGPRLGLAWAPVGRGFIVRGGYGIVYGRTPWTVVASAEANDGLDSLWLGNVAFDDGYENPRVQQASAGFEWEWMPHTALSMNYLMARGDRLPRATAGAFESTGRSRYHGVTVGMLRRFAQGYQYRLSYTLGKSDETVSETFDNDRPHRFAGSIIVSSNRVSDRFSGLLESVVKDWTLSAIYSAQRGGALPTWISLDPRIARDIGLKGGTRVTVFWEAFNLLDRPNRIHPRDLLFDISGAHLRVNPLFGPALEQTDSRTMRMAVRFSF